MTKSEARRFRDSPDPQVAATAARVLSAKRSASKRRAEKPKAPGPDKEARRLQHAEDTSDLRANVWERAGGNAIWDGDEEEGEWILAGTAHCEVSGVELGTAWELHHVQGKGERRTAQRLGNVLAVSWDVHRLIHRGDLDTLRLVAKCPTLDAEARRAAEHRLQKCEEARRAAPFWP